MDAVQEDRQRRMGPDLRPFVVVEPGAPQLAVFEAEAEGLDEVQPRAGIGAQADDVAGVGRNPGLVEHDVKHGLAGGGWAGADYPLPVARASPAGGAGWCITF